MEVLIGFIGVIIGAGIGLIPYFIERKERYKFESYKNELERKLEEFKKDLEIKYGVKIKAHQEAFSLLCDLLNTLAAYNKDKRTVEDEVFKLRNWWNGNCFYLDKDSRSNFHQLIKTTYMYLIELDKKGPRPEVKKILRDAIDLLNITFQSIQDGIKVERLDVLEKPEEKKES
jgi:hypothetical protein